MSQIKGIVAQFDGLAAQEGGHQIAIALKGNGGGFGHFTLSPMEKGLAQAVGVQRAGGRLGLLAEALQGSLAGF